MRAMSTPASPAGRALFWVGVWGGAVAWFVHLAGAYSIAEFGCVASWGAWRILGLTAVVWAILATTMVTLAFTSLSGWLAWRGYHSAGEDGSEEQQALRGMAKIGLILNGLFAFAIAFEAVPIFFFLTGC